jgi:UDPglucose 6-dehydrogenase
LPLPDPRPGPLRSPNTLHLSVVGTGYVGLVTALAFCHQGHRVTCVDIIPERVDSVSRGIAPFYEPGVAEALARHLGSGLLDASTDTARAVADTDITFLCVGTPSSGDGSYDLRHLAAAARSVGEAIAGQDRHHIVVTKSTVTPTANRSIVLPAIANASGKEAPVGFSLASNPEFLREGSALADALAPDRIVLGVMDEDRAARDILEALYSPFDRPILVTSLEGAELIKLASNSLLAIKVAFANEIANLASSVDADGYQVLEGVGLDHRLGPHFLRAGAGFGGSCFPKDLRALVAFSRSQDIPALLPTAALEQNEVQPVAMVELVSKALGGNLQGKRVALLGLAFKPDTDDVRETRALPIYRLLLEGGATVVCHDPRAGENFVELVLEEGLEQPDIREGLDEALREANVAVIQTEWEEYRLLGPAQLVSEMAPPRAIVDARRTFDPYMMRSLGVTYWGVGLPPP